ncbi:DinB family protein [Flavobacterium sp.]|uniref:DinB family protein n=1 Tax=Flavobacterium sp. TaxID=239 RepID=UPI00261E4C22|nr:DinB family protein [Flavobacterium sp.]
MLAPTIQRLEYLTTIIPALLTEIGAENFSLKTQPDKWSKKEIIGHLIDSATNNHQRFIRGQFEPLPEISYDQNNWNKFNAYQHIDAAQIIAFWTSYNKHLIEIIKRIPSENLLNEVKIGANTVTLKFIIEDYVAHLEHHLKQVVEY